MRWCDPVAVLGRLLPAAVHGRRDCGPDDDDVGPGGGGAAHSAGGHGLGQGRAVRHDAGPGGAGAARVLVLHLWRQPVHAREQHHGALLSDVAVHGMHGRRPRRRRLLDQRAARARGRALLECADPRRCGAVQLGHEPIAPEHHEFHAARLPRLCAGGPVDLDGGRLPAVQRLLRLGDRLQHFLPEPERRRVRSGQLCLDGAGRGKQFVRRGEPRVRVQYAADPAGHRADVRSREHPVLDVRHRYRSFCVADLVVGGGLQPHCSGLWHHCRRQRVGVQRRVRASLELHG